MFQTCLTVLVSLVTHETHLQIIRNRIILMVMVAVLEDSCERGLLLNFQAAMVNEAHSGSRLRLLLLPTFCIGSSSGRRR